MKLIDFSAAYKIFQHSDIHKFSLPCADRSRNNQINHIVIDERRVRSVLDVRTIRDTNIDLDHYLVIALLCDRKELLTLSSFNSRINFTDSNSISATLVDFGRKSSTSYALIRKVFLVSTARLKAIGMPPTKGRCSLEQR